MGKSLFFYFARSIVNGYRRALLMSFNTCPIVLSGPSGGGKSTIITRAMQNYPKSFAFSISHTTRLPRPGEKNGVHYWFVSNDEFNEMIKADEFLEYATFGGNSYGTSKKAIEDIQKTGRICILDVEINGVRNIRKCDLIAKYVLIRAPSLEILEQRLRDRRTETEESIQKRLKQAQLDLDAIQREPNLFNFIIINDDLDRAYKEFVDIVSLDVEKIDRTPIRLQMEAD